MANTYTQLHIQAVFTVKGRDCFLGKEWRDEVFRYIAGIIAIKGHKPIIVNGVADHVHVFFGLNPSVAISDLMREVKNNSTNFINNKGWLRGKFAWQEGYGAFSYGRSQVEDVYKYILNQEEHHRKRTFKEEYLDMLKKFEVAYDEQYLFDWME